MDKAKIENSYIKRIFTKKEKEELLKNKNILGIRYEKEIIYSGNFKLWAVEEKLKYPFKSARQIFEEAGFNMNILDERTPQRRLNAWVKKYKRFGVEYFIDLADKYYYSSLSEDQNDKRKI